MTSLKKNALNLSLLICLISWRASSLAENLLPANGVVVSGQANISLPTSGSLMVNQASSHAIINWQSFSVGSANSITFNQPNTQSAVLNRVTGNANSVIAGQINANGQVFLINPNGIAITPTGTVNVGGGFVASTLGISDEDFNAGKFNFVANNSVSGVVNGGNITAGQAGFIALLGNTIANTGTLSVPVGKVVLGSGEQATLDFNGDGFLQVAVPAQVNDSAPLIDVAGNIVAAGGRVEIKTATALSAIRDAVNISGNISTHATYAKGGVIVLDGNEAGVVKLQNGANLNANSDTEKGGFIAVTGHTVNLQAAQLSADGPTGGGTILIGGDYQGGGSLMHATQTRVAQSATLSANASQNGDGGKVVLWSDGVTDFQGNISARAAGAGNGGLAEVSSHNSLNFAGVVDLWAEHGLTGDLLLDPYNVMISAGADSNHNAAFTATGNSSVINISTLQTALAGANVTVSTNIASNGAQNGDITVVNAVTWASGNTLTLNAYRDITINSGATITASNGGGFNMNAGRNIAINADISGTNSMLNVSAAAGALVNGASAATGTFGLHSANINTHGGTLHVSASASASALQLIDAGINMGSGVGTLTGSSTVNYGALLSGNNSLTANNGGSLTITGNVSSGSLNGLAFAMGGTLTTSGTVNLQGNSLGVAAGGATSFLGSYNVTNADGDLSIVGASNNNATALRFNGGAVSLNNDGAGLFSLIGAASNNGSGVRMTGGGTQSLITNGNISLSGSSSNTREAWRIDGDTSITQNSGIFTLSAISTGNHGLRVRAGTLTLNNNNTATPLVLSTSASAGFATILDNNSGLAATGDVTINAINTGTSGAIRFISNNTITNQGTGLLQIIGTATGHNGLSNGIFFAGGSNSIHNTSTGSIELVGENTYAVTNTNGYFGLGATGTLNTTGTVALHGIVAEGNEAGLAFSATDFTADGDTLFTGFGGGALARGVEFAIGNTFTLNGGSLSISGTSVSDVGLKVYNTVTVTRNAGRITLDGTSADYHGIEDLSGAQWVFNGDATVSGYSTNGIGVYLENDDITVNSGNVVFEGISTAGAGLLFSDSSALSNSGAGLLQFNGYSTTTRGLAIDTSNALATVGNVSLAGASDSGTGLEMNSGAVLNQTSGTLRLTGNSTSGTGLVMAATSTLSNHGSDTLTLQSSRNLLIDSTIDSANGEITLLSTGDITLGASGSISGKNPVLSATGAFINNHGSNAVTASSGRWLIYSNHPAANTFGNLVSNHPDIWNSTYATLAPASVAASGNRYIYAYQPALTTVAPVNAASTTSAASGLFDGTLQLAQGSIMQSSLVKIDGIGNQILNDSGGFSLTDAFYLGFSYLEFQ